MSLKICPFIAETPNNEIELTVVLKDNHFEGFFHITPNNKVEKFTEPFQLKDFRNETIKNFWIENILPFLNIQGFDPVI